MNLPGNMDWSGVPESQRDVATMPQNSRSGVAIVRQGLSITDPTGIRGFEVDADTEAMRGTFRITIPLLEAKGRTDALKINLYYQARMWFGGYEAKMAILDGDQNAAPGWSVGLPKLLGGILIEGDGTRHPARRLSVIGNGQEDIEVSYITKDGSDIEYEIKLNAASGTAPGSAYGRVRYPDGSIVILEGQAGLNSRGGSSVLNTRLYATAMIDAHGNTTTIEYEAADILWFHSPPRIARLIDPVGREIKFYYSIGKYLTAITAPAFGGGERVLARLTYKNTEAYFAIDANDPAKDKFCFVGFTYFDPNDPDLWFGGPTVSGWRPCSGNPGIKRWKVTVVEGIYFPGTGIGYWFGDGDSYNYYGMLVKVIEQAQMTHTSGSFIEEGTLTQGTAIRTRTYNFPMGPPATGDRQAFPKFTTLTETFAGINTPLITHYNVIEQTTETTITVTLPDNRQRITIVNRITGLPRIRQLLGSNRVLVSQEDYIWTVGADGIPKLTQLTETDSLGRKKRIEYTYNLQGNLQDIKTRDWVHPTQINNAPLLRWQKYVYVNDPVYIQRGVRNLVRRIETYNSGTLLPEERADYEYDGLPLIATPGIERNLFSTSAFRSDLLSLIPANANIYRGLITKIKRWIAPQEVGNTATIDTEMSYTLAGKLSTMKIGGRTRFTINYSNIGGYALPESIVNGAFVSKGRYTTAKSVFTWDLGVGELVSVHRPSMGLVRFNYDSAMRLESIYNPRTNNINRRYGNDGLSIIESKRNSSNTVTETVISEYDGLGQLRRIVVTPSGAPATESLFEYNLTGKLFRVAQNNTVGNTPSWTVNQYDQVGRIVQVEKPDGSISLIDYDRVGVPGNLINTGMSRCEKDAWGRTRYIVTDALGRINQVLEEPNTTNRWVSTSYTYDARSNLVSVYADANQAGPAVVGRRFQYDGLSRLTHRYLNEYNATLNANGQQVSRGLWSDIYHYNDQSLLIEHIDPRGVLTNYDYQNDPLDRLLKIRVNVPSPVVGTPAILPVPDTHFTYMHSGDPMRLKHIRSVGVYEETYYYDTESRLRNILTIFDDQPASPINTRVNRNPDNQIDMFSIGIVNMAELQIGYLYNSSGRRFQVNSLSGNGSGNWNIAASFYPEGTLRELVSRQGTWEATETFFKDDISQRIIRQIVAVAGATVIDNNYYYDQASRGQMFNYSTDDSATGQLLEIRNNILGYSSGYSYGTNARLEQVMSGNLGIFNSNREILQYGYDAAGNRISSVCMNNHLPPADLGDIAADGQRSLVTNPLNNHIVNPGFMYDAAGNTVNLPRKDSSALILEYDGLSRLSRIERNGTTVAETYIYNHNNQLIILRRADGSVRYSVWYDSESATHFEALGAASPLNHSETGIYLGGKKVARIIGPIGNTIPEFLHHIPNNEMATSPGNNGLFHSSNLRPFGSDASGNLHESLYPQYHSYGRTRFGIDYAINRYYDPETGKFLQPDPSGHLSYKAENPQSLNLYTFTLNDPINNRDPIGLDCSCDAGGVCSTLPDGATECSYLYGKNVYETIVRANKGDGEGILRSWLPSNWLGWSFGGTAPGDDPSWLKFIGFRYGWIPEFESKFLDGKGAVTPGLFTLYPTGGSTDPYYNQHEPGHAIQYQLLQLPSGGTPVLFITLVALPSVTTAAFDPKNHDSYPWETSANTLVKWYEKIFR